MLIVDRFPPWWPFLVSSYRLNAPEFTLLAIHTGERPPPLPDALGEELIHYVHMPLDKLTERFASKLGATAAQASAKFASGKGLSDLKPFYGQVFEQEIAGYSHWGWVDWDLLLGDLRSVIGIERFWEWDSVTLGGATLGFAWAGQLTVFQNRQDTRQLYQLVDGHLALGLKADGDGQSGWEERVFLRDVLRKRPNFAIHFHMAAQMDYKAQWLTWIPFDHYWHKGRVWRCAKGPLQVEGRPPLLLSNSSAWHADVALIQSDPQRFYKRKERVCIRWDLSSSPWMCCPHSIGVSYLWRGGKLSGEETPFRTADAKLLQELSEAPKGTGVRVRVPHGYSVCHEGAFFHAGLKPKGAAQPTCTDSTWALLDDIGRFSGDIKVLREGCSADSVAPRRSLLSGASRDRPRAGFQWVDEMAPEVAERP